MTVLHAFFVLMFCVGVCAAAFFIAEFLALHFRHRRIARNRRWARHNLEQHESYFAPLDKWPKGD